MKRVVLEKIEWPDFGHAEPLPPPTVQELQGRMQQCRIAMSRRGLSHLVVYADREHFANLCYLTYFDPRFEEALMIISRDREFPLVVVGNECVGHLNISPLLQSGQLRYERYQPFSLLNQPRNESRPLKRIFESEGIRKDSTVGCVGWKYFSKQEFDNPETILDLPAYLVDTLRSLAGKVLNVTDLFMAPSYGLRATCTPYEIAVFEFSNVMASEGMKNVLKHFKAGVPDFELVKHYQYTGYPLSCHIGMKSSGNLHYGLSSPTGSEVRRGDPCSTGIAYWGSNICRAGWVAADKEDLPGAARDYVENFAAPYFLACAAWLEHLRIGVPGGELQRIINEALPYDQFGVFLNPGHLIHLDEWLSSPIYRGSTEILRSGMYFQTDIIPRSAVYSSSRMEDGLVLADAALQQELARQYPTTYARCLSRREFIRQTIGITLSEDVLPLSNTFGLVPPYFLDYRTILTIQS